MSPGRSAEQEPARVNGADFGAEGPTGPGNNRGLERTTPGARDGYCKTSLELPVRGLVSDGTLIRRERDGRHPPAWHDACSGGLGH